MVLIAQAFRDGGPFMYPILATSIFAAAIIIERVYFLAIRFGIDDRAFLKKIQELVGKGDPEGARNLCNNTPIPKIVRAALECEGCSVREVQNSVDEAAMEVLPLVERRVHYLAMAANVATLLGLLGTIVGLMQSFNAVAGAEAAQKGAVLAKGIAIALNTTAYGLTVAIPCLFFYAFIQSRANTLVEQIDRVAVKMVNMVSSRESAV
ncbi:MAG: MotA/TolQ/ExbB proton channel family protein [bacterium]|nr:MotA/TolQ/ExbB proton channel family protein [bacterium]MDT8366810.1 MotA/TolQ/ExbB proton channel family protein [bacterium]